MGNKDVLNRWLRSGAGALLALGLLAGCSNGEPEPTFTPTLPDSTPSPDDSREPDVDIDPVDELEPPEIPEFSDDPVEASQQMVEFFIAAYGYGYGANDPEPLIAVSHPECKTCDLHAERMKNQASTGEYVEGGALTLQDIETRFVDGGELVVNAKITQSAFTKHDADQNQLDSSDRAVLKVGFVLFPEDETWVIRAISVRESSPQ